jgi:hypothetical protein
MHLYGMGLNSLVFHVKKKIEVLCFKKRVLEA